MIWRGCFTAALAFSAADCRGLADRTGRSSSNPSGFAPIELGVGPFFIGKYTSCAQGTHSPSGRNVLDTAGFQDGAVLTLAQSGSTLSSTYIDQNGVTQSLSFSPATAVSASVSRPGQVIPGFSGLCVGAPGNQGSYPASMTVSAGNVVYNAGMIFLTLVGDLRWEAGACGTLSQPGASFWLLCTQHEGGVPPSIDASPPPVLQLSVGQFSCRTQVETFETVLGVNYHVASGASGKLGLTADGTQIVGQYSGDPALTGTLRFGAVAPTTALAVAGQTLMAPCLARMGVQKAEALPIAAASLNRTDDTLFFSFAGTMAAGSSCPGAQVVGTAICSM